jgi:hypothetical protein
LGDVGTDGLPWRTELSKLMSTEKKLEKREGVLATCRSGSCCFCVEPSLDCMSQLLISQFQPLLLIFCKTLLACFLFAYRSVLTRFLTV